MAEHLTIPGALEWDAVERHSIATLRYAGGKEHDVKYVSEVAYDAALALEAALREELDTVRDLHTKQCCVFCNDTGNLRSAHKALQQRLTVAERFVQRLIDCSKGYDSVAKGYLNDILTALKPSKERP